MADIRTAVMSRLYQAVEADYPGDFVRQSSAIQHLEHLVRDLAAISPRQARALLAGLAEAIHSPPL